MIKSAPGARKPLGLSNHCFSKVFRPESLTGLSSQWIVSFREHGETNDEPVVSFFFEDSSDEVVLMTTVCDDDLNSVRLKTRPEIVVIPGFLLVTDGFAIGVFLGTEVVVDETKVRTAAGDAGTDAESEVFSAVGGGPFVNSLAVTGKGVAEDGRFLLNDITTVPTKGASEVSVTGASKDAFVGIVGKKPGDKVDGGVGGLSTAWRHENHEVANNFAIFEEFATAETLEDLE